jgi:hypothetical protein
MTTSEKRQQGEGPAQAVREDLESRAALTTKARLDMLEGEVAVLRRDLAATRAWCIGLEEELGRLRAMLHRNQ